MFNPPTYSTSDLTKVYHKREISKGILQSVNNSQFYEKSIPYDIKETVRSVKDWSQTLNFGHGSDLCRPTKVRCLS